MKDILTHDNLTEASSAKYFDHFEVAQARCRPEDPLNVCNGGGHEPEVDGYAAPPPGCREERREGLLLLCEEKVDAFQFPLLAGQLQGVLAFQDLGELGVGLEFREHFLEQPADSQDGVNVAAFRCHLSAQRRRQGIPPATTGRAGACAPRLRVVVRTCGRRPRVGTLPLGLEDQVDEPNI
jgi:hypothetical protein